MSLHPNEVLLAPVVSEKSYEQIEANHRYSFRVHPDAHKTQIRQAVEELFNVHVERVNVIKVRSKPKRRGLVKGRHDDGVKILGDGQITKSLTVQATKFSASAAEKIAAAGGQAMVV